MKQVFKIGTKVRSLAGNPNLVTAIVMKYINGERVILKCIPSGKITSAYVRDLVDDAFVAKRRKDGTVSADKY